MENVFEKSTQNVVNQNIVVIFDKLTIYFLSVRPAGRKA